MMVCWLGLVMFMMLSVILYFLSVYFLWKNLEIMMEWEILSLNSLSIEMAVMLDWVSLMFTSFVFFISSMIIIYSSEYMADDKFISRFIYIVILFVLSMMVVILSSNLVFVLLGWDGLGLVSYLLVIYYQNVKSSNAGMLTALSNRVGDASILLSIMLMMDLGSWNYLMVGGIKESFLGMLIVMAAMTKSAQIPFSAWLPAAMAAPTPVSSLVHSSTLVTAGVYLLFRFSDLLVEISSGFLYISLATMFMAGLGANYEFDLKKIIALSTLSQLGMMMVIFYLGDKNLAFFHLLMHALFKALLFMCAGVIIHSIGGFQDIRFMGGLVQSFPVCCVCFSVSSLSLCGLPFLSGFYSKDLIAEFLSSTMEGCVIYFVFFLSVGLTVSYSVRLIFHVFVGRSSSLSLIYSNESGLNLMLSSMVLMSVLVISGGSVLMWLGFCTPYFMVLPQIMKLMVFLVICVGVFLGYEIYYFKASSMSDSLNFYNSSMFVSGMWNMPFLSTSSLNSLFLSAGKLYMENMDFGWIEYYGSKGLFSFISGWVSCLQMMMRNHLKFYLLLLWGLFLVLILLFIV
uniref:NADH-ubiquinone oxidoreductase chain 5 n=1 Tax=Trigonopterus kotamobagensis TaxID=2583401 RepID=A0A7H1KI25_9CUCU|nr:NADH dehydrogenase subunit 5 [Trigonopterus kotamobagensis]QNT26941.1 NADH dehydrogenase subunit 5 [Trigonopterus kotamobagensis]